MLVDQAGKPIERRSTSKRIRALFRRGKVVVVSFAAFVAALAALSGNIDSIRETLVPTASSAAAVSHPRVKVLVDTPLRDSNWNVKGLAERGEEYRFTGRTFRSPGGNSYYKVRLGELSRSTALVSAEECEIVHGTDLPEVPKREDHRSGGLSRTTEANNSSWLTVYSEFMGFDDGGAQYPVVGCPSGEFFVASDAAFKSRLPDYPGSIAGYSWMGPMNVVAGLDTNLPVGDYIVVNQIRIEDIEFIEANQPLHVIVHTTSCASVDPGGNYAYDVILAPGAKGIKLLLPNKGDASGPVVIRHYNWQMIRLNIRARRAGWYRFNIRFDYRYRGVQYTASFPEPVLVNFLEYEPVTWVSDYRGDAGLIRLAAHDVAGIIETMNHRASPDFPPALAGAGERSGRSSDHPYNNNPDRRPPRRPGGNDRKFN